jgi:hypothetical protein
MIDWERSGCTRLFPRSVAGKVGTSETWPGWKYEWGCRSVHPLAPSRDGHVLLKIRKFTSVPYKSLKQPAAHLGSRLVRVIFDVNVASHRSPLRIWETTQPDPSPTSSFPSPLSRPWETGRRPVLSSDKGQPSLKRSDGRRQVGLSEVEEGGGSDEVAFFGHGDECLELAKLHSASRVLKRSGIAVGPLSCPGRPW